MAPLSATSRPVERPADAADLRQRAGPDPRQHGEDQDEHRDQVEQVQVEVHAGSIGEVR